MPIPLSLQRPCTPTNGWSCRHGTCRPHSQTRHAHRMPGRRRPKFRRCGRTDATPVVHIVREGGNGAPNPAQSLFARLCIHCGALILRGLTMRYGPGHDRRRCLSSCPTVVQSCQGCLTNTSAGAPGANVPTTLHHGGRTARVCRHQWTGPRF